MNITKLKDLRQVNRSNSIIYKLLTTLIGECEQISKNPSSDQIIAVIQKMYKDNNATMKELLDSGRQSQIDELVEENNFLEIYLPKQLTEDELIALINSQVQAGLNMPKIMKYLTENYKGRYDGKTAARICNMLINGTIL